MKLSVTSHPANCFVSHSTTAEVIYGQFTEITANKIVMEWNVEGFQRPPEIKTVVEITLREDDDKCILTLTHKHIADASAAAAKHKAWTEILDDMEKANEP
jgi:uncharacterized protein YndB with AHSA1/START domain